jgi:hypothetical protein
MMAYFICFGDYIGYGFKWVPLLCKMQMQGPFRQVQQCLQHHQWGILGLQLSLQWGLNLQLVNHHQWGLELQPLQLVNRQNLDVHHLHQQ